MEESLGISAELTFYINQKPSKSMVDRGGIGIILLILFLFFMFFPILLNFPQISQIFLAQFFYFLLNISIFMSKGEKLVQISPQCINSLGILSLINFFFILLFDLLLIFIFWSIIFAVLGLAVVFCFDVSIKGGVWKVRFTAWAWKITTFLIAAMSTFSFFFT